MTKVFIVTAAALGITLLFPSRGWPADEPVAFLRGDANADGRVSLADVVMLRRYVFEGQRPPKCLAAADANDNGSIDLVDEAIIINGLFYGGDPMAPPFPSVGLDPTPDDGTPCESYDIVPPEATDDILRVGDVQGSPGEIVDIPVFLTSSVAVEGFQFVMRYKPGAFTPLKGSMRGNKAAVFDGTPWEGLPICHRNVEGRPERGYLVASVVGSLFGQYWPNAPPQGCVVEPQDPGCREEELVPFPPIPPGSDQLIFKIRGTVSTEAEPGMTVNLDPWNGPNGVGVEPPYFIRNEITYKDEARYVNFLPRLQGGRLFIVGDVTFFNRGDANSDTAVDLGDAVFVLNHLFLGAAKPSCPDAADADDNGAVELTDAVVILGHLFLGEAAIASPYPQAGRDSTPDSLAPCRPAETN